MPEPSDFSDFAELFCQMDWDPECEDPEHPADDAGKARSLQLLEGWLRTECDWVRELIAEVELLQEVIDLGFVERSASQLERNCAAYQRMLPQMLNAELDITGVGRMIATLGTLLGAYRELVRRLKATRK